MPKLQLNSVVTAESDNGGGAGAAPAESGRPASQAAHPVNANASVITRMRFVGLTMGSSVRAS
jgi:hypothetical protein